MFITIGKQSVNVRSLSRGDSEYGSVEGCSVVSGISREEVQEETELRKDRLHCCTGSKVVVAHGLSSCGSRALEHRLNSCGTEA